MRGLDEREPEAFRDAREDYSARFTVQKAKICVGGVLQPEKPPPFFGMPTQPRFKGGSIPSTPAYDDKVGVEALRPKPLERLEGDGITFAHLYRADAEKERRAPRQQSDRFGRGGMFPLLKICAQPPPPKLHSRTRRMRRALCIFLEAFCRTPGYSHDRIAPQQDFLRPDVEIRDKTLRVKRRIGQRKKIVKAADDLPALRLEIVQYGEIIVEPVPTGIGQEQDIAFANIDAFESFTASRHQAAFPNSGRMGQAKRCSIGRKLFYDALNACRLATNQVGCIYENPAVLPLGSDVDRKSQLGTSSGAVDFQNPGYCPIKLTKTPVDNARVGIHLESGGEIFLLDYLASNISVDSILIARMGHFAVAWSFGI
ncbi:MAG TPA: hypothetical protein VIF34_04985 [Methylocystis sp.]